jgi:hypothetical protein
MQTAVEPESQKQQISKRDNIIASILVYIGITIIFGLIVADIVYIAVNSNG